MKAKPPAPEAARPDKVAVAARAVGLAATTAAAALAVLLAVRPFSSYDIGYHLAYGDHFLDTGRIVQTNRFIYTKLRKDILADPKNLGPGCRYDPQTGTYSFINANWLSQVVMAAAYRAGRFTALWVLQWGLVAGIFALVVLTMRRWQVAWHWIAPAVVLAALTAYERFSLRPEVFGYLVLAGQWCLLVGRRFGWRGAVGVICLQVLAVNLHSYFLLGVALAGAMFGDALIRWLWRRAVRQEDASEIAARAKWLGVATAGLILAALINPWHFRGAVMPVRTLLFISKYQIAGATPGTHMYHPWSTIGEFTTPFAEMLRRTAATKAYVVLLCLTCLAGAIGLLRRRWGWVLATAGMAWVSLKMRRNIAPAAMILAPLSLIILTEAWGWLQARRSGRPARPGRKGRPRASGGVLRWVSLAVGGLGIAAAGWWIAAVLTQQFYFSERRSWRFGRGVSYFSVPLDAADWINTHQPKGRLFTDYDTSSNLMYFTSPRREVPVLTNTWAFPPYLMQWVLQCTGGRRPFEPIVTEYDVGVVALRSSEPNRPLIQQLCRSPDWAVAHIGVRHVLLVRSGPNAALVEKRRITQENFDVDRFIEDVSATDPVPGFSLNNAAILLAQMGWQDHALAVWEEAVARRDDYFEAHSSLGTGLAMRGTRKLLIMQQHQKNNQPAEAERWRAQALADWQRAEEALRRALQLKPDFEPAERNLQLLQRQMAAAREGKILIPRGL